LIVITNDDRPGIIGAVGTVFGDAQVNISFMGLGRDVDGENALMAMAIDTEPKASLLSDLEKLSGVQSISSVFLG
jgi:D-3-phosphoglycerate dehydrogenase